MITVWLYNIFFLHQTLELILFLDPHSRHGYSTSPRRYAGGYALPRRAPPDPRTFEFPATLKQYAEWFRHTFPDQAVEEDAADKAAEQEAGDGSKPRNGIKTKWEKYKKEFAANQVSIPLPHCSRWILVVLCIIPLFWFIVRQLY